MTGTIVLHTLESLELELCTIGADDLENLRMWKNAHRDAFFFKDHITAEGQQRWYAGYLERPHDFMFIIRYAGQAIGCIGFRYLTDKIDVYNVIMGAPEMSGKGYMGIALRAMLAEAVQRYPDTPLTLIVLKDNPALRWYQKNGFTIAAEGDTSFDLIFSSSIQLKPA